MEKHWPKARIATETPVFLDSGSSVSNIDVAYQIYGPADARLTEGILICHAFSGDQYVASENPVTHRKAWWPGFVGPGLPIDTSKYFVICSNVLGGCMGTFGPCSVDAYGEPLGLKFPVITISDMVRVQKRLIDYLGIGQLRCVVGGSMGAMQVLEWLRLFPENVRAAMIIAGSHYTSPQNIAFSAVGRKAIMSDPDWRGGRYVSEGTFPRKGLALARMIAHITYMSAGSLRDKLGRRLSAGEGLSFSLEDEFDVEGYLEHQGNTFTERFDPNSYIYLSRALDYFDLAQHGGGYVHSAFRGMEGKPVSVSSFSSDWLYPPEDSKFLSRELTRAGARVHYTNFRATRGHDSFLLEAPQFHSAASKFLRSIVH